MTTSTELTHDFSRIEKLVGLVSDVEAYWSGKGWGMCWFRGCATGDSLLPGQYRPSYRDLYAEKSIFIEFQQRARGFLHREMNDWEMFFLMQHYRVPTRLLDWTENCLVALYFALTDPRPVGDPCVWMLNPLLFNTRNGPSGPAVVVMPDSIAEERKYWINAFHPLHFDTRQTEFTDGEGRTQKIGTPIAMFPPTVDRRIVAQQSVFTLHGRGREPVDRCCEDHSESKADFIHQFIFHGDRKGALRELKFLGITRQAVFPDLEGLGMEFRNRLALASL